MRKRSQYWTSLVLKVIVLAGLGLLLVVGPALAQESGGQSDLIINGSFEEGFQSEVGIGYGWGAFSNGNAAVGWNVDSWGPVVIAGQYSQLIEIKDAVELDRYAGIYQTVSVVPGQLYKLTIKGLIRSAEGDVKLSNYGYRLQYGVDYDGGTAWELVNEQNWQEIQWDEQPLNDPLNGTYRFDTFETTITAKSDKLTLFIRAWKKWLNNGVGLYDLDEISLVGLKPEGVQAVAGQVAAVGEAQPEPVLPEAQVQTSEHDTDLVPQAAEPEVVPGPTATAQPEPQAVPQATPAPQPTAGQLPVSGQGKDDTMFNPIEILGAVLVLVLLTGAFTTLRQRRTI